MAELISAHVLLDAAAQSITTRGLRDPTTAALLIAASIAANAAYAAGHRVTDIHRPQPPGRTT